MNTPTEAALLSKPWPAHSAELDNDALSRKHDAAFKGGRVAVSNVKRATNRRPSPSTLEQEKT